jgi:hypothetical protein
MKTYEQAVRSVMNKDTHRCTIGQLKTALKA